jgi:hypothetical protein
MYTKMAHVGGAMVQVFYMMKQAHLTIDSQDWQRRHENFC